jgi:hypothetical protein
MSRLLLLPLPIRKRIWEMVLLCQAHDTRLLRTCRQIHTEADGIVCRRPQTFQSQTELSSWIEQRDTKHLDQVENVTLHLQNIDTAVLVAEQSWPKAFLLELYRAETEKILADFAKLPNIRHFALYKTDHVQPYLYQAFYVSILTTVTHQLPLLTLGFHSEGSSLAFLKSLPDLRGVTIAGYSTSTPMETLNILSRLRRLTSLELIQPATPTVPEGLEVDLSLLRSQSLTRDVIKGLRGLEDFAIYESGGQHPQTWALFSQGFLQALDAGHRTSLQSIRIVLENTPGPESQRSFNALLTASTLKYIDVSWPMMEADLVQSLPRTVEILRIPANVLNAVQLKRGDLPLLREVHMRSEFESGYSSPQVSKLISVPFTLWFSPNAVSHVMPLSSATPNSSAGSLNPSISRRPYDSGESWCQDICLIVGVDPYHYRLHGLLTNI